MILTIQSSSPCALKKYECIIPADPSLNSTLKSMTKNTKLQKGLVLMYHRVTNVDVDPWNLCVTPERFSKHLQYLTDEMCPCPLADIQKPNHQNNLLRVAITFDDGYLDNFINAFPLLESYNIPATIFIVCEAIDKPDEFWWDELEHIILFPGNLPSLLRLSTSNGEFTRKLIKERQYTEQQILQDAKVAVFDAEEGSRLFLFRELWELLSTKPPEEKEEIFSELWDWSGRHRYERPTYRAMKSEELKQLSQSRLIEIGAHTMTHPRLPTLSQQLKKFEIEESARFLERSLGIQVCSFSFPFGQCDAESVAIAAELFERAVITQPGPITAATSPMKLNRIAVENWSVDELDSRLRQWVD